MSVDTEPTLSNETLSTREGETFSLDIVGDPDDPELQAELVKDINYNDDSEAGAMTYLYRDRELWSVTTDESGQKRLVRNSEILHGDMLTQYQEAMTALAGGATDHSLEVRAAFLDTETEEFYSRQKLELIDGNRVQVSHELFSQAKEVIPSDPTNEGSERSYLDGPTFDHQAGPDSGSLIDTFGAPDSPSPELPAPPASPEPILPKSTEPILAQIEPKPEPQLGHKSEPESKPEPKPEPRVPMWGELSRPKPAGPDADAKAEYVPPQWLPQTEPKTTPEPANIFNIPMAKVEPVMSNTEKPLVEDKKPELKATEKPAPSTDQPNKKPERPAEPQPNDSPEPTGGRTAEQPVEAVAPEAVTETEAQDVQAEATIDKYPADTRLTEAAPSEVAAVTETATLEASGASAEHSVAAETVAPDAATTEAAPAVIAETAPVETPAVVTETPPAAAIVETPASLAETAPVSETIAVAPEVAPLAVDATPEPATALETAGDIQTVEAQPIEAGATKPQVIERVNEVADEIVETADPSQLEAIAEVDHLAEAIVFQDFAPVQSVMVESVTPIIANAETSAHEQPAIPTLENDLSEELTIEPAVAELTTAPAATAATVPPAAIATTASDTTIHEDAEGIDISMTLEEPTPAPRRQARTRPAHLTVGTAPAPTAQAEAYPDIPTVRAEIPPVPTEATMTPADVPSIKATEPIELQASPVTLEAPVTSETPGETPVAAAPELTIRPQAAEPVTDLVGEPQPEPELTAAISLPEIPRIVEDDGIIPTPSSAPIETFAHGPEPMESLPVVQNSETKSQPVSAKPLTKPAEVQSWADDFGGSGIAPELEPLTPAAATFLNAENFARPLFNGLPLTDNQFASTDDSDDDDPGLIILFDQSERRHAARRSHNTRSTAA